MFSRGSFSSGVLARGRERDLSGSLVIPPMPLPCSKTPVELRDLAVAVPTVLPPDPTNRRPQHHMISRLTQGFSIRCLRFASDVTIAHARLASGWRAAPLPGGGRTLWMTSKGFRFYIPFSFPGLTLTQAGFMQSVCCKN